MRFPFILILFYENRRWHERTQVRFCLNANMAVGRIQWHQWMMRGLVWCKGLRKYDYCEHLAFELSPVHFFLKKKKIRINRLRCLFSCVSDIIATFARPHIDSITLCQMSSYVSQDVRSTLTYKMLTGVYLPRVKSK